jgi:hypothetical protein
MGRKKKEDTGRESLTAYYTKEHPRYKELQNWRKAQLKKGKQSESIINAILAQIDQENEQGSIWDKLKAIESRLDSMQQTGVVIKTPEKPAEQPKGEEQTNDPDVGGFFE